MSLEEVFKDQDISIVLQDATSTNTRTFPKVKRLIRLYWQCFNTVISVVL